MSTVDDYIADIEMIVDTVEKIKGFWDETGLDMHIAVLRDQTISISTKHWYRVHYIKTVNLDDPWDKVLKQISEKYGRKLIRSTKGKYVYIHKLNEIQTKEIFNEIVNICEKNKWLNNIERHWELSWDIDDAYLKK